MTAVESESKSKSSNQNKALKAAFDRQRQGYIQERKADALADGHGPSLAERKSRLRLLRRLVLENQELLATALSEDFGHRSLDETEIAEVLPTLQGIDHVLHRLPGWMRTRSRLSSWIFWPGRAEVRYEPKGVVGVIVPWNYPLYLATGPLIDALAAGNRVMVKMPEATPTFSARFAELIERYFDSSILTVVQGGVSVSQAFSRLPFDHLLFTGSTGVGRQVMCAAAENLTPVTLELGGKSPAYVAEDADLAEAARRIAFGKCLNAGQTCVAPDYVLVPRDKEDAFVRHLLVAFQNSYPDYLNNQDYSALIHTRHRDGLLDLLAEAEADGAKCHLPPGTKEDWRTQAKMPLIAITEVPLDAGMLSEEIFGPLLPIVPYNDEDEAIAFMQARPNPLALYYFGAGSEGREQVLNRVPSGGAMINNTLVHIAHQQLPFGGKGTSGMGAYHGVEGFRTFSHARSVVHHGRLSTLPLIFPPYGRFMHRVLKKLLR